MLLAAGKRVGPYEIVSPLGAGGMGEVYKARDSRLDRFIAIKVLRSDQLGSSERQLRFAQEAKAASALNHPGIVTIYDVGTEEGLSWIAMEFVAGKTLDDLTPREGMKISDALRYAVQASDALARAHAAGIVHRDLKPGNIMVTAEGQVKILDFGLAKLGKPEEKALAAAANEPTRTLAALTREGTVMGTAPYMSPEQAEGAYTEARSDIFSWGSVLYEMLTGRRAFQGDSQISTLSAVLRDDPKAPSEVRPDLPAELDRIVMRCLKKDPARRFQTAADLKVALVELQEEYQSGAVKALPAATRKTRGAIGGKLAWVALAALPLCTAGGWFLGKRSAGPEIQSQPVPLTSYQGNEGYPSFSPDGNQVSFSWNGERESGSNIYIKLVGPGAPLRLTNGPGLDGGPAWSPDGSTIAFERWEPDGTSVILIPALGGPERKLAKFRNRLANSGHPKMVSWSPDGKWLAASGSDEGPFRINLISVETGESRVLTTPPGTMVGDVEPAISPDGKWLAYARTQGLNVSDIWVMPLSKSYAPDGSPRKIEGAGATAGEPEWTTDSKELLFSSGLELLSRIYRVPADGSAAPRPIEGLGDGLGGPAVARRGTRLAFHRSFRNSLIWRVDTQTGKANQFIASTFREVFPQYSPDGKRVVFYSNRTGVTQIYTSEADGSGVTQMTFLKGTTTGTPRWSPDGQRISFDSNSGGQWQIYTISAGGGKPVQMTHDDFTNVVSSWSRDGKWIYFVSIRNGVENVWKMPSGGGAAVQVTHGRAGSAMESVDGKTLYFTKVDGPRSVLMKMPVEGGAETMVAPSIHRYSYEVVDKGVYFSTPAEGADVPATVNYLDFATGKTTVLYKLPKPVDLGLTVSPDRKYVLFAERDFSGSDLMLLEGFR